MSKIPFRSFQEVVKADAFCDPAAKASIVNPNTVPMLESSVRFSPFSKSSNKHGRSMEDPEGVVFTGEPITDEFGDVYTRFTIKGADCSLPSVSFYTIEPSLVRVRGMLDASTFERCRSVSALLREQGVLTEWPIFHKRPFRFPDGEKDVTLNAFRSMLYDNYIEEMRAAHNEGMGSNRVDNFGRVGVVGVGLSEIKFGVMYRAGLSPVRLWELTEHANWLTLRGHVADAIKALQIRRPEHFACWPEIEILDPEDQKDQDLYLSEILPEIMGENLARFHNATCYHKYLHGGNWTLAGEIVDLDSVRCDVIDEADDKDYTTLDRLDEVINSHNQMVLLGSLPHIVDSSDMHWLDVSKSPISVSWGRFKSSYFAERYQAPDLTKLERIILTSHLARPPENMLDWEDPELVPITHPDVLDFLEAGVDLAGYDFQNFQELSQEVLKEILNFIRPIVQINLHKMLEDEGVANLPLWFNEDAVIREEGLRLTSAILRNSDISFSAV